METMVIVSIFSLPLVVGFVGTLVLAYREGCFLRFIQGFIRFVLESSAHMVIGTIALTVIGIVGTIVIGLPLSLLIVSLSDGLQSGGFPYWEEIPWRN